MLLKLNRVLIMFLLAIIPLIVNGQSADTYFHNGAKTYIDGKNQVAKSIVNEGLSKYPSDPKLTALKEKLDKEDQNKDKQNKEEQNKDQQPQDNKDQEQKDQEQKDQQQKDQEKKDQEDEKKEDQQDQQQKEGEKSDEEKKEQPQPTPSDKLKEMNISEEKAKMILEAMKNNEIQYIQQNRRKATKKKESGKPDW